MSIDPPSHGATRLTPFSLVMRNLRYFRAANLSVALGMAVGTAVLSGALLVGDSVRGSLRDLATQRLGPVDHALIAGQFFSQSLADRLAAADEIAQSFEVIPAIVTRGGASTEQTHTGGVQIAAFGGAWVPVDPGQTVINNAVADALQLRGPSEPILLQLPTAADVPRDATLARRSLDELTAQSRLSVSAIAGEPGLVSMFSLEGGQRVPRNAWMNLADLQRDLRQPGRANLLLARSTSGDLGPQHTNRLNEALRRTMMLDDYGLKLTESEGGGEQVLSSRTTYIHPAIEAAARRVAQRASIPLRRVAVHLVNNVVKLPADDVPGAPETTIHYAVAAGISSLADGALAEDEVALNEWAASRLGAKTGDRIRLDYYQRSSDGALTEVRSDRTGVGLLFRVSRILPMSGLGADRTLTPDYPGLTDKASIREAPAELGIDESLLTDDDDVYWQQHRAAPKVFISLEAAKRLWDQSHGALTSLRIPAQHAAGFERELLAELNPADVGMSFRPIKAEQLAAASGSTDFSMLFVGLSFFLIVAAALMVAMLFRLAVEQRARQFGLFGAMGFTPAALYRMAWAEGLGLAIVGGVVGLGLAVAYTWLIVAGLRTWWVGAVGTTALRVHVEPMTLAIGFTAGLVLAVMAIAWAARGLRRVEPVRLLAGRWSDGDAKARSASRTTRVITVVAAIAGLVMVACGLMNLVSNEIAFFGGGALLLLASLCGVNWIVRSTPRPTVSSQHFSLAALGMRTATRHPPRTLLTVSLVALASFLLVAVAGMRQEPLAHTGLKSSGTGGYRLIVHADVPLLADLNTREGREQLGVRQPDAPVWQDVRFTSLRRWAGEDASCLNLTRPTSPTILGVPSDMSSQSRFAFADSTEPVDTPWSLLDRASEADGEIPMIADAETARYILKLDLGETLPIADQNGRMRQLKLVATLKGSIFQSELLIGEDNFREMFPAQSGFGVVLAETNQRNVAAVRHTLGEELQPFAMTIDRAADRLAAYQRVANTYLSTFQTLGSLGLLLGTIGLAVVLLRGLFERRAELALLAAVGFRPGARLGLVIGENAALLMTGLAAGTICALIAVLPRAASSGQGIHFWGLAAALAAVLVTGLAVLGLAAWAGGRNASPADLRRE